MLAACLPLLLPTGFCLCKFGLAVHPQVFGDPPGHHDDHAPGCPGSHGADQLKWVEPPGFAIAVPPLVEGDVVAPPLLTSVFVSPLDHDGPWPSAPPLFISHCALVI